MSEVLGSSSFLNTPDVNGLPVLLEGSAATTLLGVVNQISVSGTVATPIIGIAPDPVLPGTGSLTLPSGPTSARPVSPLAGMIRFNTTLGYNEKYTGAYWSPFGIVLQVVNGTIPSSTGTTQIPWDNTTPLITEGHQIWSRSFTPVSATSTIIIEYAISTATSTANRIATTSVFYGNTLVNATATQLATANVPYNLSIKTLIATPSDATVTIQGRCGLNGSGTLSVNQANLINLNGNAPTRYIITEIE